MMKKILLGSLLLAILLSSAGCTTGVPQEDYDDLLERYNNVQVKQERLSEEYNELQNEIDEKIRQLENGKVRYFKNRSEAEQWLAVIPKLGTSEDAEEWLEYALYYQKLALDDGYIISISYNNCNLYDTFIRIDINNVNSLDNVIKLL